MDGIVKLGRLWELVPTKWQNFIEKYGDFFPLTFVDGKKRQNFCRKGNGGDGYFKKNSQHSYEHWHIVFKEIPFSLIILNWKDVTGRWWLCYFFSFLSSAIMLFTSAYLFFFIMYFFVLEDTLSSIPVIHNCINERSFSY